MRQSAGAAPDPADPDAGNDGDEDDLQISQESIGFDAQDGFDALTGSFGGNSASSCDKVTPKRAAGRQSAAVPSKRRKSAATTGNPCPNSASEYSNAPSKSAAKPKAAVLNLSDGAMLSKTTIYGFPDEEPPMPDNKCGQGRKTAEDMATADAVGLAGCQAKLKQLVNMEDMPALSEAELSLYCKDKMRHAHDLINKASSKASGMKRRKADMQASEIADGLEAVVATASNFHRVFSELALDSPAPDAIDKAIACVEDAGFSLAKSAKFKRARVVAFEHLKFGTFKELCSQFSSDSTFTTTLREIDATGAVPENTHADRIFEQMLQRLVKALPGKMIIISTGVQSIARLMYHTHSHEDTMALTSNMLGQVAKFNSAFAFLVPEGDRGHGPVSAVTLPQDALNALSAIEAVGSKPDPTLTLFHACANLPQGSAMLAELRICLAKKIKGAEGLNALSKWKDDVQTLASSTNEQEQTDAVTLKKLLDKMVALKEQFKGKAEAEHIKVGAATMVQLSNNALKLHALRQIVPHLAAVATDLVTKNEIRCTPPHWKIQLIRDSIKHGSKEEDHAVFKTHDLLVHCKCLTDTSNTDKTANDKLKIIAAWNDLAPVLKLLIPGDDSAALATLERFGEQLSAAARSGFSDMAAGMRDTIKKQIIVCLDANEMIENMFTPETCEELQRLASALPTPESDEATQFSQNAMHFLAIAYNGSKYLNEKGSIVLSAKPDKNTAALLKSLKTARAEKEYFKKLKAGKVAAFFLEPADKIRTDHFVDLLTSIPGCITQWDSELAKRINDEAGVVQTQVDTAMGNLVIFSPPAFTVGVFSLGI